MVKRFIETLYTHSVCRKYKSHLGCPAHLPSKALHSLRIIMILIHLAIVVPPSNSHTNHLDLSPICLIWSEIHIATSLRNSRIVIEAQIPFPRREVLCSAYGHGADFQVAAAGEHVVEVGSYAGFVHVDCAGTWCELL